MVSGIRLVDRQTDSRVNELPSWVVARQKSNLSGVLWFSVSDQSTVWLDLGQMSHRPGLSPDRRAICLVFCGFRYPISRQTGVLSGIWVTVLGCCPTEEQSVRFFVVSGIQPTERRTMSPSKRPSFWDKNLFVCLSVFVNVFLDFWTGYRMVR